MTDSELLHIAESISSQLRFLYDDATTSAILTIALADHFVSSLPSEAWPGSADLIRKQINSYHEALTDAPPNTH